MSKLGKPVDLKIIKTLRIKKNCSCGKIHEVLPENAVEYDNRYFFNCTCNSTLVFKKEIV